MKFKELGNGIFFVSDDLKFYNSINTVTSKFKTTFSGYIDRTPVNVGWIRQTYGDHELYKNLRDDEYIHAGGSESNVISTQSTPLTLGNIPKINLSNQGILEIKSILIAKNGKPNKFEVNTYLLSPDHSKEPIQVKEMPIQYYRKPNLSFLLNNELMDNKLMKGYILNEDGVQIGEFSGTKGNPTINMDPTYLQKEFKGGTHKFTLKIYEPKYYVKQIQFTIAEEGYLPISLSVFNSNINRYDLVDNFTVNLIKSPKKLHLPEDKVSCSQLVEQIYTYVKKRTE